MTLTDIMRHLAKCAAQMNDDGSHSLAMRAQVAIEAVENLRSQCSEEGLLDTKDHGDWDIRK